MDRGIAYSSKICARREHERRQKLHKQRVGSIKPCVDSSQPRTLQLAHVQDNLKKEQMLEERYSEIDRENRILLKKMSSIMKQPPSNSGPATPRDPRSASAGPSSLNKDARKKELLRITRDNQLILKRIQQAQPVYNHVEWEGLNRQNVAYLKNSAEYPLVLRSPRGRPSEMARLDGEDRGRALSARSAPVELASLTGLVEDTNKPVLREKMLLGVAGDGISLGRSTFLVEMLTDGRTLQVYAQEEDSQVSFDLIINETSHRRLFRDANGDYSLIAQKLSVLDGRLVFDAPAATVTLPPLQPAPQLPAPQQAWLPREEPNEEPRPGPAAEEEEEDEEDEVEDEVEHDEEDKEDTGARNLAEADRTEALEEVPEPMAKTPTPPLSSRPSSRPSSRLVRPRSYRSTATSEDDELDATAMVLPLTRGSVRAEVNVSWDPPGSAEIADVNVRLRGLTPSSAADSQEKNAPTQPNAKTPTPPSSRRPSSRLIRWSSTGTPEDNELDIEAIAEPLTRRAVRTEVSIAEFAGVNVHVRGLTPSTLSEVSARTYDRVTESAGSSIPADGPL